MKTYSIIMPIHNAKSFLGDVLPPLRDLGEEWQVILVDDGSTDGSDDVARNLMPEAAVLRLGGPFGPAYARNEGVKASCGEILLFLDSDVVSDAQNLQALARALRENSDFDAVFGAYDDEPRSEKLVSKFRNLLHHFVHTECPGGVGTFWSGFGAIRRSAFEAVKGFDQVRYSRPSVEDIELGGRLCQAGHRARVSPELRVKHLKEWTLKSFLWTDIFLRARPWTALILEGRVEADGLNLRSDFRNPILVLTCWLFVLLLSLWLPAVHNVLGVLAAVYLFTNFRLYIFFARYGLWLWAPFLLALHHLCAIAGAALALWDWLLAKRGLEMEQSLEMGDDRTGAYKPAVREHGEKVEQAQGRDHG